MKKICTEDILKVCEITKLFRKDVQLKKKKKLEYTPNNIIPAIQCITNPKKKWKNYNY